MDKLPGVSEFGRFTLDLRRGCVRKGVGQVELRPKAFEVLGYLAANAGRLVSKQELLDAVWPNVTVSDDSLVQCIRELRSKLGDDDHSLIKTVPRRGYLLEAAPASTVNRSFGARVWSGLLEQYRLITAHSRAPGLLRWGWIAASILACLGVGVGYLLTLAATPGRSELFTAADAQRLAAIADSKLLPLPPFEIAKPDPTEPAETRRLVGIWVSDKGWINSKRQMMLIVTSAADGMVAGYVVHGPAQPLSPVQSPAHFRAFKANVAGRSYSFSDASARYVASFTDNRIEIALERHGGGWGGVVLDPLWTLTTAEQLAQANADMR